MGGTALDVPNWCRGPDDGAPAGEGQPRFRGAANRAPEPEKTTSHEDSQAVRTVTCRNACHCVLVL